MHLHQTTKLSLQSKVQFNHNPLLIHFIDDFQIQWIEYIVKLLTYYDECKCFKLQFDIDLKANFEAFIFIYGKKCLASNLLI